ncbi:hypothetical protein [Flavobacterium sp. 102]|uniref:hypothetical protein n=1 Tax=Flavobacterium sp. 102 TaxID=2135623 RepID=UPI000EB2B889|nr:hypothetical protein [Flavobacterium sp. 102]RKS01085.1 hypothetical protein C8C84_0727 [Flavobacterium sp. 102]
MKIKLSLKNLIQFHQNNANLSKTFIVFSGFLALAFGAPFLNLLFALKPEMTSFSSHIISNVALNDLDISKRVNYYYYGLFSVLFFGSLFYYLLYQWVGKTYQASNENESDKVIKALLSASLIGIAVVIISFFIVKVDISIYFLVILGFVLVLNLKRNHKLLDFDLAIWPVLIALPIAQYLFIFFKKHNLFQITPEKFVFKKIPIPLDPALLTFVLLLLITALTAYFFRNQIFKNVTESNFYSIKNAFLISFIPVLLVPIVFSILIEITNIFNIRFDIVFNNPFLLFTLLFVLAGVVSFVLFKKNSQKTEVNVSKTDMIGKYYYPLLFLGFMMIITQPWRMASSGNEFFETANHGLAIDHFFRYGSIPIVENYDAHMLSIQLFAYLFSFLNGYEPWSPFLYGPYFYVIEIFVVYFIFKRVLGSYYAFLILLSLPIITVVSNEFIVSGLLALFILKIVNNKSTKQYYYFWAIAFFLCLYKLDIGFAAILSGIGTFLIVDYYQNRTLNLKKLASTGAVSVASLMGLFVLLCLIKGINPIARLGEFLLASMSNQNWAVVKMGDMDHIVFRLSYYVLPIITMISLGYVFFKLIFSEKMLLMLKTNKKQMNVLIFFLFFSLFFIFNAPRGIVRHNFEYGNIIRITSTIPLVFLMLTLLLSKSNKLLKFLSVFIVSYLLVNANNTTFKDKNSSFLNQELASYSFHEKFLEAERFNGTRVRQSSDLSEVKTFKNLLDAVLKPNETYFDFSSKNYYHALVGRKNPCYLNQTPLMINGDKGQDLTIEEIKTAQIPIVLMPIKNVIWSSIDDVYVDYKFYRISEYIYANYTPLYKMGSFDVYARNDKKNQYSSILTAKGFFNNKTQIEDFKFLLADKVTKSNLQITTDPKGKAIITSTGANAFFSGMIQSLKSDNKINDGNGLPITLRFNITTVGAGSIKIYYNQEPGESYSEERIKEFPITEAGTSDLSLDFPKMPSELMVAINMPTITINNFSVSSGSSGTVSNPEKKDYYLLNLPRIWAEYDGQTLFDMVKPLEENVNETTISMNKSELKNTRKPYYVYLEANANFDFGAKIELMDGSGSLASFYFNIIKGKHRYAIRVSSNYYWWSTQNSKITFTADQPIEVLKYAILSDDGKEIQNYKAGAMTLSNVNDENWKGGVGLKYNLLLLDFSPNKEKLLVPGSKIKFADGTFATIVGHNVAGNYIQVSVKEDVKNFVNSGSYPNPIRIVK